MSTEESLVSPAFAALVRRRELSLLAANDLDRARPLLDDSIIRPLLDEQLRECVTGFAQLAQPTGSRLVSAQGLDRMAAYHLFEDIPVLPEDRDEAEELACAEFRRLAAQPGINIPGAALTLCPNGEVTVRPVIGAKFF